MVTPCVWFISGSTDQRTALGKCIAFQKPLLRRGIWKGKSSSGGKFFGLFFCFMFLRMEFKKIKLQQDTYEMGLYRHEIIMTMIVRMRRVTRELLTSHPGWLIDVTSYANSVVDYQWLLESWVRKLWALSASHDEPMLCICYASVKPGFMPDVFISLASSTMSET